MATDDIREWGRKNGFTVGDEGRLPPGLRAAFDNRSDVETPDDGDTEDTVSIDERPPAIVKRTTADRVREIADRVKKTPVKGPGRPRSGSKSRVSVEKVISGAWSVAAAVVTNLNPAVGRVLSMQAPVAGLILEDKVKNTVADRLLQPLARTADGGNTAIALMGPPLLVQALTMQPHRAPQIIPMLRYALRSWVMVAGDHFDKIAEEEKAFESVYGERIDEMLRFIIAPLLGDSDMIPPNVTE